MTGPIGRPFAFDAAANNHVEAIFKQPFDHQADTRRVVGRISVHQHIDVRFHIGEHAADDKAFALVRFQKYAGAGCASNRPGIVRRVVVENKNIRCRQRGAKIRYDFDDGCLFIVAICTTRNSLVRRRPISLFLSSIGKLSPAGNSF